MNNFRSLARLLRNSSAPNAYPLLNKIIQQFRNHASAITTQDADFLADFLEPELLREDTFTGRWLKGMRGKALAAK